MAIQFHTPDHTLISALKYSTTEKELLDIVFSCKYIESYLFGRELTIETDVNPYKGS